MDRETLRDWIRREADSSFSRSAGPGGQNVNKVSTRVTLRVSLEALPLSERERGRLREKLAGRITREEELLLSCMETRSQGRNREIAADRMTDLICRALEKEPPRVPTRPGRAAGERRIRIKKARGSMKKLRRQPPEDA